jgi:hypothetical protein
MKGCWEDAKGTTKDGGQHWHNYYLIVITHHKIIFKTKIKL